MRKVNVSMDDDIVCLKKYQYKLELHTLTMYLVLTRPLLMIEEPRIPRGNTHPRHWSVHLLIVRKTHALWRQVYLWLSLVLKDKIEIQIQKKFDTQGLGQVPNISRDLAKFQKIGVFDLFTGQVSGLPWMVS